MYYIVAELTYSVCLLEKIYKSQLLQTLFGILTVLPNEFPLLVREYNDGQLLVMICASFVCRSCWQNANKNNVMLYCYQLTFNFRPLLSFILLSCKISVLCSTFCPGWIVNGFNWYDAFTRLLVTREFMIRNFHRIHYALLQFLKKIKKLKTLSFYVYHLF